MERSLLTNRWVALAVLFLARTAMGFQMQAVPALSPLIVETYGIDLTQVGLLIALYLSPGLVIAYPGGALGARLGDRRVITLGLTLMCVGGALMAFVPDWPAQLAGRLLAGIGAVTLNVLMTKLVTDYFAGREIATAMGIFVNSWPVGIALALLLLPGIAMSGGLAGAMMATLIVCIGALVLFVVAFRPAPGAALAVAAGVFPSRPALWGVLLAGLIWGLYNAALGMVFGFGPAMLAERGWTLAAAGGATSLALWLASISVPLGGIIADRTGRNDTVLGVSCVGFAVALLAAAETGAVYPALVGAGLVGGLAAGPIMSLPAQVLAPQERARGMGVFYTVFYVCTVGGPVAAGWMSDAVGTARISFHLGAVMLVATLALTWVFRIRQSRAAAAGSG